MYSVCRKGGCKGHRSCISGGGNTVNHDSKLQNFNAGRIQITTHPDTTSYQPHLLQHIEGVTHGHSAGHPGNSGQCSVALWRDWTPDFLTSLASQQRSRRHITPQHAAATLGLHPNIPSHGSRYRSGCDGNSPVCTCPITGARPTSVFPPSSGRPACPVRRPPGWRL